MHNVNSFGQFIHYTDKNISTSETTIFDYLKNKNHTNISVEKTEATVEDCFIDLCKETEK
jgi:hypothetical protein